MKSKEVKIGNCRLGGRRPLFLIAGPCVIESETKTLRCARKIKAICKKLGVNLIFKSSYDKANRTSLHSYRGPGLVEGLRILRKVKKVLRIPVLSDVHCREQLPLAAGVSERMAARCRSARSRLAGDLAAGRKPRREVACRCWRALTAFRRTLPEEERWRNVAISCERALRTTHPPPSLQAVAE